MKIFEIINRNIKTTLSTHYSKKSEEKTGPIITISREKGSGGRTIAEQLVKKLGKPWNFYDKEIVERIAKESNISTKKIEELEETEQTYFQDLIRDLLGRDYFSLNSYQRTLFKVLYDIEEKGYAVILGRGANFVFKDALKIRVIAEAEERIKWLMEHNHLSRKEAIETTVKTESESRKFISNLYHKDITDPYNFDLFIKTCDQLSIDEAMDIVVTLAKKKFKV